MKFKIRQDLLVHTYILTDLHLRNTTKNHSHNICVGDTSKLWFKSWFKLADNITINYFYPGPWLGKEVWILGGSYFKKKDPVMAFL